MPGFLTAAAIEAVRGFKALAEERQSAEQSPLTLEERGRLLALVSELRRQLDLLKQRGVIPELSQVKPTPACRLVATYPTGLLSQYSALP
jgi:hypothetical protein